MIQFMIQFIAKAKLFPFSLLLLLKLALAQLHDNTLIRDSSCSGDEIMNGSALEINLKVVMTSLVENVGKTGYNISSHEQNGDKVYGLAQCRGDLNASTCRACVSNATKTLAKDFSHISRSMTLWGCFLKFNTDNFYSKLDLSGMGSRCHDLAYGRGTVGWELDPSIAAILSKVMDDAVSSNVGFSTGNGSGIYAMAQCRRDLSMSQCTQCLDAGFGVLPSCGNLSTGAVFNEEFVIHYDRFKFYGDAALLPSPPSGSGLAKPLSNATAREAKRHRNVPLTLGLSIAAFVTVMLLLVMIVLWKRKSIKRFNFTPSLPRFGIIIYWVPFHPNLKKSSHKEVLRAVHVALLCTQASALLRPSMSKVIMFLTSKDVNLPEDSNTMTNAASALGTCNPPSIFAASPGTPVSQNTISTSFSPR